MAQVELDGRVAIVTGAGGGLGRSHALALAARGAKVVINDLGGSRDGSGGGSEMADAVVAEIVAGGGEVLGYLSLAPEGHVGAIYLRAAARGRGVGRRLIEAAKARHPEGLELEVFEVNADARRSYAREGFAEMAGRRRIDTDEGLPVLRLRWEGRG